MQTVAEHVISRLEEAGFTHAFGIPGVHTLEVYRALGKSDIEHVQVRHEQAAAFMADGFARSTGRPALVTVITGPGLLNAATGIAQAYSDSVPMFVLSTVRDRCDLGRERGRLHEIRDQRSVVDPFVAFSHTLLEPEDADFALDEALEIFNSGRPRPIFLEIPLDVLPLPLSGKRVRSLRRKQEPTSQMIGEAVDLIGRANSIVIVAGGGAVEAGSEVSDLANAIGAVVATSVNGRGIIAEDDPRSLGSTMRCSGTLDLLARSDLVIACGTELAETDTWIPEINIGGKLIRIDIDPRAIDRNRSADLGIVGDTALTLRLINERFSSKRTVGVAVDKIRTTNEQALSAQERIHIAILDALGRALSESAIVSADSTLLAYTANIHRWIKRPRRYLHCTGFGALGYALPAAIGAKLAEPGVDVIAILGDGGFQFTIQDLATARSHDMSLPIIIWDNDCYGAISDAMEADGIAAIGVSLQNPDFEKLAAAFDCAFFEPSSFEDITKITRDAFAQNRPTLIRIHEEMPWLKVSAEKRESSH